MPKVHVVKAGECIDSIAFKYGFFPETVWQHPQNEDLRDLREDPNILFAGDQVHIPDLRQKTESRPTNERHTFRRKGVPARFRIQLLDEGEPRADLRYVLVIDGGAVTHEGTTDADGVVDVCLSPGARRGLLTLGHGEDEEEIELFFGRLDPVTEASGVRQRLFNLGFLADIDATDEDLAAALRRFQAYHELEISGEADADTQAKLVEMHDTSEHQAPSSP
jgi:hypothetical protein